MLACSNTNTPCRKVRACSHKTRLATKETGDQPKNWRANNARSGGQRPKNRRPPLLFNLEGVLASCRNYTWVLSDVSALWSTSP